MASPQCRDRSTNALLVGGVIGGPLFVVALLVEGATRIGYDAFRSPVSVVAIDDFGWTQTANFIITGFLMLAFAIGLYGALRMRGRDSILGPILIGVYALGLLGSGAFAADPGAGWPPGVPGPIEPSLHATLHDIFSLWGVRRLGSGMLRVRPPVR
jgi:hypothetical protein